MLFFKKPEVVKPSKFQVATGYAKSALAIGTNLAFLGACLTIIRNGKTIEEQKALLKAALREQEAEKLYTQ